MISRELCPKWQNIIEVNDALREKPPGWGGRPHGGLELQTPDQLNEVTESRVDEFPCSVLVL